MSAFFQQLKNRKIFRAAGVYAVVAWLLIQIADTVLPALQMPEWTVTFVTILLILGFFPTLIVAWLLDATETAAIKKGDSAHSSASAQPINYIILVVVLVMAGFQIFENFRDNDPTNTSESEFTIATNNPVMRTGIDLGPGQPNFYSEISADFAISPDGSFLIALRNDEEQSLWRRNLDQLDVQELYRPNEPLVSFGRPVISPDSENVLFLDQEHHLAVVSTSGGAVRKLTGILPANRESSEMLNADLIGGWNWLDENTPVWIGANQSIYSQSLNGDTPELLLEGTERRLRWPVGLPNSNRILYTVVGGSAFAFQQFVEIYNPENQEASLLIDNAFNARYVPTGHILFGRQNDIWAVPFDIESLEITGPESMVVQNVFASTGYARSLFSVSDTGTLVYLPAFPPEILANRTLHWVDRNGTTETIPLPEDQWANPQLSPDESMISIRNGVFLNTDFYIWDIETETLSQLTFLGDVQTSIWSPDSQYLYFLRGAPSTRGIWRIKSDGSEQPEQLLSTAVWAPPMFIDETANELFYVSGQGTVNNTLDSLTLANEQQFETVLPAADLYEAALSPNRNWLAVAMRQEGGLVDVFAYSYSERAAGGVRLVTRDARQPMWSQDGDELFYVSARGSNLASVRVVNQNPFTVEDNGILVESIYHSIGSPPSYDVTADGQRFLVLKENVRGSGANIRQRHEVVVVNNWFSELLQLSPVPNIEN